MSDVVRSPALGGVVEGGIRYPGSADANAPAPTSPHNVAHRGGAENPSAAALVERFGDAIVRRSVTWGETTVVVTRARFLDIVRWLHDDPSQRYDYLVDVTGVEYRDPGAPLEVVYHLRSLPFRRFLRVKVELSKRKAELWVPSLMPIYSGADWLERECYDMFGIRFEGHPDLRRILMWESYNEGYPLRKDFPLRGRFSRAEQLSQALAANPEAHYSMNELSIAEAFEDLPADMKERLARGERVGE
ncbi:MAG: NADH-quinone oxidoreductase subunit C [Gemmatimonadaceae bacterium]|nr:NADH-quinone oxidoreductase subunit C [Gemmatimonadaceae bacterium]